VFNRDEQLLSGELLTHWYKYVTVENGEPFVEPLGRLFSLDFTWPNRRGLRSALPSRLIVFKAMRRWFGIPRPIMKDPIAAMSAEWLAETFHMDVICLVRHPAAFVVSLKKVNWRFGFDQFLDQPRLVEDWLHPFVPQLRNAPPDVVGEGALLWLCVYHVLTSYIERHPEWICWRLEDLSADPVSAFESIFTELDLSYTHRIRRHVEASSSQSNPAVSTDDPHCIKRNSRAAQVQWRAMLTAEEIARIRRVVEPVACNFYSDKDW
jgi:hypothetical protein